MITSRERVRNALNFLPVDRILKDLGSSRVTGMSAWTYRALRSELGLTEKIPEVFDLSQMNVSVDIDVLDALGCDFIMLPMQNLSLGLINSDYKNFTFWDSQIMHVPGGFSPHTDSSHALLHSESGKNGRLTRIMPKGCRYFENLEYPDIKSVDFEIPHIPEKDWPLPQLFRDEYLRTEEQNARSLFQKSDKAIVSSGCLGMPVGYAGPVGWAMKIADDAAHAEDFMQKAAEIYAKRAKQYLQAVGAYIDVLIVSQTDFGSQQQELFNPAVFKTYFVPAWKKVTDAIHSAADVKIFIHSCGSIFNLLEHIITAGVDIYNPVQWSADKMEREKLTETYGGRIVFWGGGVNTQNTFPFGTPEEVLVEMRDSCRILGRKNGYILNPGHNIQADVPIKNICAFYRNIYTI